jgi:transcriptional regulator with GAF, ATPase, and Fis domain
MSFDTCGIIGKSSALQEVFRILAKVAPSDSTILVTGESGTGKELLVRALHRNSRRADKPFVPINCGAIPRELLESELFGHEKGAFTHAIRTKIGRFEMAQGGTVFLDEIGEMDLSLQVKILRVLQEREFERVGGSKTIKADVRVVAATNRDLEEEVSKGTFREDLFYRLNVIPIVLPPLRERGEDVIILARYFLKNFCTNHRPGILGMAEEVADILARYSWPGNVRELENFMERMSILCDGESIGLVDLPDKILRETGVEVPKRAPAPADASFRWPELKDLREKSMGLKEFLDHVEERLLTEALGEVDGIKNKAAEVLGIKRTTLIEKLKKKNML